MGKAGNSAPDRVNNASSTGLSHMPQHPSHLLHCVGAAHTALAIAPCRHQERNATEGPAAVCWEGVQGLAKVVQVVPVQGGARHRKWTERVRTGLRPKKLVRGFPKEDDGAKKVRDSKATRMPRNVLYVLPCLLSFFGLR